MFVTPAYAQGAGAPGGMEIFIQIIPFILIFVIMYFLLIRPQQQRVKAHRAMIMAVRKGDVVVTGGGLIGKIKSVNDTDDEVTIELAKGVDVRVVRSSISDVKAKTEPLREAKSEAKSE
ncbi:Sec translocon accessory complex subunit YajC [Alphaproteobacteria bacterium SO-S41]|nr:Sec translocon accessory complex subunit YajC [Alphaproteobacteria bacterium SO-S41]